MEWGEFLIIDEGRGRPEPPRPLHFPEGLGDRLRTAAFAELQAIAAFQWAQKEFAATAPAELLAAWDWIIPQEQEHYDLLMARMVQLKVPVQGQAVSLGLWYSLVSQPNYKHFCSCMTEAEEKGRKAGERFYQYLLSRDPITAEIFGKIAREEAVHVEVARRFIM